MAGCTSVHPFRTSERVRPSSFHLNWQLLVGVLAGVAAIAVWTACRVADGAESWESEVARLQLSPHPVKLPYAEEPEWYTRLVLAAERGRLVGVGGSGPTESMAEAVALAQTSARDAVRRQVARMVSEAWARLGAAGLRPSDTIVVPTPGRVGLALAYAEWPDDRLEGDPRDLPFIRLDPVPRDIAERQGESPTLAVVAWTITERHDGRLRAFCRVVIDRDAVLEEVSAMLAARWLRRASHAALPSDVRESLDEVVRNVWRDATLVVGGAR